MKEPAWVARDVALALHERLLADYGGAHGVRDEGLLDSAMARPQNLLAYGEPDLFELATCYAAGICRNHPFVDGNKRTAFTVAGIFLEFNGTTLISSEAEVTVAMIQLADGSLKEAQFTRWLRDRCEHRRPARAQRRSRKR